MPLHIGAEAFVYLSNGLYSRRRVHSHGGNIMKAQSTHPPLQAKSMLRFAIPVPHPGSHTVNRRAAGQGEQRTHDPLN